MDREYLINDYVNYNDEMKSNLDTSISYLEGLQFRIKGCKSIAEIKKELGNFLENNNLDDKVREDLIKISNDFNETTDVFTATKYLEDYLKQRIDSDTNKYNKSNDDVVGIKKDLIDKARTDLEDVGIKLTGDEEKIYDDINNLRDVEKIEANVEEAKDYFENSSEEKDNNSEDDIEISIDTLGESLEHAGNKTVLNEAIDNQPEFQEESPIIDRGDGSIEINGDAYNQESMNFMAMMTAMLVSSVVGNDLSMNLNLDLRLNKNMEEIAKYKAIFGNFPLHKMTDDNKLSPELIKSK